VGIPIVDGFGSARSPPVRDRPLPTYRNSTKPSYVALFEDVLVFYRSTGKEGRGDFEIFGNLRLHDASGRHIKVEIRDVYDEYNPRYLAVQLSLEDPEPGGGTESIYLTLIEFPPNLNETANSTCLVWWSKILERCLHGHSTAKASLQLGLLSLVSVTNQ